MWYTSMKRKGIGKQIGKNPSKDQETETRETQ